MEMAIQMVIGMVEVVILKMTIILVLILKMMVVILEEIKIFGK